MKELIIFIAAFILIYSAKAQDNYDDFRKKAQREYNEFKKQTEKEYRDFRERANAEYAEFMRRAWEEFTPSPAIPVPPSPEPPVVPVAEPQTKPSAEQLPVGEIVPLTPPPSKQPQPITPIPEINKPQLPNLQSKKKPEIKPEQKPNPKPESGVPEAKSEISQPNAPIIKPDLSRFTFDFYNTACSVRLSSDSKAFMHDISEKSAADIWTAFSTPRYDQLVTDCLNLRKEMKLCDWAYYQLIATISDKYYGSNHSGESVLLQLYILTQSGYKVRVASANNKLTLLVPLTHTVYEYSYITIGNEKYYVMNKSLRGSKFKVFNREFAGEQPLSLRITSQPVLKPDKTAPKTFVSKRYPEVKATVETNRNLIDFYNSRPVTSEWNLYVEASLSEPVKQSLYSSLRRHIESKTEIEAVNILLNFVQTAFTYQTDDKQFGYERPLFGDETFFYPGSDCEDRAILFSILVRELLNLKMVFLHYDGHLATAVRFSEDVSGDYIIVNDKKFTVCDPTFFDAGVGRSMDTYKNAKAQVVQIN